MGNLRVGIALYNAGRHLAAHEPLEELWLEAPAGERDDCLQGLIQATAAVYKADSGNRAGAVGLAESAADYLTDCADAPVAVTTLADWLDRLVVAPALPERERPPTLRIDGEAVGIDDLTPAEVLLAGDAVAETDDDGLLAAAVTYADSDVEGVDKTTPLVALVRAYIAEPNAVVRDRLQSFVERRRTRESDVEGVFE